MELSNEVYDILIAVGLITVGFTIVAYMTRNSKNFRSSRNRKARKQHP